MTTAKKNSEKFSPAKSHGRCKPNKSARAITRTASDLDKNFEKIVPREIASNTGFSWKSESGRHLLTRAKCDPNFQQQLLTDLRTGGPLAALVADLFEKRFSAQVSARLARRDSAFVEASSHYQGTFYQVGELLEADLRKYETGEWRFHQHFDAHPSGATRTKQAIFFDILKFGGEHGARGGRAIGDILKRCSDSEINGSGAPVSISCKSQETLIRKTNRRRGGMNEPKKQQQFLDALQASEIGKEVEASVRAATIAARKKLVDAMAANDAKAEKEMPLLAKVIDAAIAKVRTAEEALKAANNDLWRASQAKSAAGWNHMSEQGRLAALLADSEFSGIIDDFQRELRWAEDDIRKLYDYRHTSETNPLTAEVIRGFYSNKEQVQARIAAGRNAIDVAESLRFVADQSDIPARLDALRKALPEVRPAVAPDEQFAPKQSGAAKSGFAGVFG